MASFVRKTMELLGLVDADYDDYEPYEEQPVHPGRPVRAYAPEPEMVGAVRPLAREPMIEQPSGLGAVTRPAVVRPFQPAQNAKPHVLAPEDFTDAKEIGDRLKAGQPVIVNLQNVDSELSRRMIDFCSGATYVLGGSMERVAKAVFLLTPANVEVSADERRRLQERGFHRA